MKQRAITRLLVLPMIVNVIFLIVCVQHSSMISDTDKTFVSGLWALFSILTLYVAILAFNMLRKHFTNVWHYVAFTLALIPLANLFVLMVINDKVVKVEKDGGEHA